MCIKIAKTIVRKNKTFAAFWTYIFYDSFIKHWYFLHILFNMFVFSAI